MRLLVDDQFLLFRVFGPEGLHMKPLHGRKLERTLSRVAGVKTGRRGHAKGTWVHPLNAGTQPPRKQRRANKEVARWEEGHVFSQYNRHAVRSKTAIARLETRAHRTFLRNALRGLSKEVVKWT